MKVEVITEFDDFLNLEGPWNDLLKTSGNDIVFLTHEWFHCWWLGYKQGRKLYILVIKENEKIIGIVPLLLTDDYYRRRLKVKKICFLESGITPRVDFISSAERKADVIRTTIEYLLENNRLWDMAKFNKILSTLDTYNSLNDTLINKSVFFGVTQSLLTPFISTDSDWDSYYADRSRKFRKVMRNKINRIKRQGKFEVQRIRDKDELEKNLPIIFKISKNSWKATEKTSIPNIAEQLVFYKKLTSLGGQRGWINIWLLKCNNKPIAFEYHLRYKGKAYSIRADYDDEYKDLSPGSFLEYNIIRNLFEDPEVIEYDFCGDNYQYTLNWTTTIKEHVDFLIFNATRYSRLLGFTEYKIIPPLRRIKDLNSSRKQL